MKNKIMAVSMMLVLLILVSVGAAFAQGGDVDSRYVGTVPAPEFPDDLDWLNVDAPLTVDGLRGKIILLDFWTYGCINCIHMIPVLRDLEEKYAEELVVIGVHSAKFANESETDNIRQIVQRYEIHHPVINDSDFNVWRLYRVSAWPTFVIIDPLGNIVAAQPGEVPFEAFDTYLSNMIEYYDANPQIAELDRTPLELALEGAGDPGTPLLFPGKVLVDEAGGRLFIADSNHHRIVVADLETYEILATIGTGQRGYTEGDYAAAQFDQPQGMEIEGNTLYIADVNNHAIRAVDLAAQQVSTLAGTGRMGRGIVDFSAVINDPLNFDLRSPWDVELGEDRILYIAMAGTHQIWQMNLESNTLQATVGNGREAQLNTTLARSELAQPSGLHYVDGLLYFADSESSTIRVADFAEDEVRVISGTTQNSLFDFGDVDGELGVNRLQHALGVTSDPESGLIYIADTYNSKIKVYDPTTQETVTLAGTGGNGGYQDGALAEARFDEPGGLEYSNGRLYVADTNNHVIRVIDLEAQSVETIQFPNPQQLVIERNEVTILGGNAGDAEEITLETQSVAPGEGELTLSLTLPDGYKINELTDSFVTLSSEGEAVAFFEERAILESETLSLPLTFTEGDTTLTLEVTLFYCEAENEALCLIDEVTIQAPVTVTAEATSTAIQVQRDVTLPEGFAGDL